MGENCYGKAKVDAFVEKFGNVKLDAFYSDSLSDLPMMKMSKESYLTKNGVVKKLKIKNFDEVKNEKN
ncbi:MAG: hypothetical protein MJ152_04600 [Clostridia bacterium]|nr:hypothetical protein [Clostridia bacterium]